MYCRCHSKQREGFNYLTSASWSGSRGGVSGTSRPRTTNAETMIAPICITGRAAYHRHFTHETPGCIEVTLRRNATIEPIKPAAQAVMGTCVTVHM